MRVDEDVASRFYSKVEVNPNGCWEWVAAATTKGYGRIRIDGKLESATRLSYEMHVGTLPNNQEVCHKCDNPKCVRPSHLFVGTRSDNMRDCSVKGRLSVPDLTRFGYEMQATVLEVFEKSGSLRSAAKELGCNYKAVKTCLENAGLSLSYENGKPSRILV